MGSLGPEVLSPKDKNQILFDCLPASLPISSISGDADLSAIASAAVQQLETLQEHDLAENVIWRDLCALTGTFRTFYEPRRVSSVWKHLRHVHQPFGFTATPGTFEIVKSSGKYAWFQTAYTFETRGNPGTKCSGFIGLIPDPANRSQWKIWLLTTLLEEFKGFGSADYVTDPSTIGNAVSAPKLVNGTHTKDSYQCVVVGAGFSGLCTAGRLKALGVDCLVLEKNPEVGDNWKNRYDSARFHTTKSYCDFPLTRTFTKDDPTFPGRLDLIRSYDQFVNDQNLDVRCSSCLKKASYSEQDKRWTLSVETDGNMTTVYSNHLVLAMGGLGSTPNMPQLYGRELYRGKVMHSVDYKSANQWAGKAGVVVGSANTAHDVAEDMVDAGMSSVTLLQRNATPVFPIEWYKDWMDSYYNERIALEYADRRTISLPVAIARHVSVNYYKGRMDQDPEKLNALERAGFMIERSGDMVKCAFGDGAGGHHTDVGGGAKIIAGQITVKSKARIVGFTPTGLEFADGSQQDADVIVFCTGYHTNMLHEAIKIVGPEVGRRLDDFWGIDDEGELRGAFKRMNHPGIWYIGGGAPWARFGSRFLALQIKADVEGCALPLYNDI